MDLTWYETYEMVTHMVIKSLPYSIEVEIGLDKEAKQWCYDIFGPPFTLGNQQACWCRFNIHRDTDQATQGYRFAREEDLTMFTLKWR